jgi:hypothetical protein
MDLIAHEDPLSLEQAPVDHHQQQQQPAHAPEQHPPAAAADPEGVHLLVRRKKTPSVTYYCPRDQDAFNELSQHVPKELTKNLKGNFTRAAVLQLLANPSLKIKVVSEDNEDLVPELMQLLADERPAAADRPAEREKKGGKGAAEGPAPVNPRVKKPRTNRDVPLEPNGVITVSKRDSAPQMGITGSEVTNRRGYCLARATRGVSSGKWAFEIRVEQPKLGPGDPSGVEPHVRVGWATEKAEVQAYPGYDAHGFCYRSKEGDKFRQRVGSSYGAKFGTGDVITCVIDLPPHNSQEQQQQQLGSLSFWKNGEPQGVAFADIPASEATVYFPAVALYMGASVSFNFGPEFAHPAAAEGCEAMFSAPAPAPQAGEVVGETIVDPEAPKKENEEQQQQQQQQQQQPQQEAFVTDNTKMEM